MTELRPGDQLDHFRIEALAARSGMASIFRAIDLNTGRQVGIKVPHPEMECDPVFFDRFQREAQIGRELAHPGVMKVMPDDSTGRIYMVMEWLEGRLLRDILAAEGKLSPQRAVGIALAVCDALEYIHSHGVVHRDLKPENIMVDAENRVKLIDFGIAAKAGARRLTFGKFSQLMGTAEYISPEQVNGKRGDARSDIYALGVMMYEMLTGRAPFQGANPLAIMNDRLRNHPVPPREIEPRISPELQEIVYRATERTPAQRYSKASDLAWDLANPRQVRLADRSKFSPRPEPLSKRIAIYGALAAIPALIFSLLIYLARQG